jgi:hypothetical protein
MENTLSKGICIKLHMPSISVFAGCNVSCTNMVFNFRNSYIVLRVLNSLLCALLKMQLFC